MRQCKTVQIFTEIVKTIVFTRGFNLSSQTKFTIHSLLSGNMELAGSQKSKHKKLLKNNCYSSEAVIQEFFKDEFSNYHNAIHGFFSSFEICLQADSFESLLSSLLQKIYARYASEIELQSLFIVYCFMLQEEPPWNCICNKQKWKVINLCQSGTWCINAFYGFTEQKLGL